MRFENGACVSFWWWRWWMERKWDERWGWCLLLVEFVDEKVWIMMKRKKKGVRIVHRKCRLELVCNWMDWGRQSRLFRLSKMNEPTSGTKFPLQLVIVYFNCRVREIKTWFSSSLQRERLFHFRDRKFIVKNIVIKIILWENGWYMKKYF